MSGRRGRGGIGVGGGECGILVIDELFNLRLCCF